MANESLIAARAEQDGQGRRTRGLDGASSTRPIGKRIRTPRIFSTKKVGGLGAPPTKKGVRTSVGDLIIGPTLKTRAVPEGGYRKCHSYKRLPTQLRRDGFTCRQIAREGNAAIYEQRWTGCVEPSVCYEVIRIRRRDGFQIGGRFVEPAEVYPNSEAWGVDGFTFTDKGAAFAKLRALGIGQ